MRFSSGPAAKSVPKRSVPRLPEAEVAAEAANAEEEGRVVGIEITDKGIYRLRPQKHLTNWPVGGNAWCFCNPQSGLTVSLGTFVKPFLAEAVTIRSSSWVLWLIIPHQ